MISGGRLGTIGKVLIGVGAVSAAVVLGHFWPSKRKRPEKTTGDARDRYANDASMRALKQVTDGHVPLHIRDQKKLDAYLKRQTAVKIRNVYGIYATEYLARNRKLVPFMTDGEFNDAIKKSRQIGPWVATELTRIFTYRVGDKKKPFKPHTIVLLPNYIIKLLDGTKADRLSFDSALYHEVEGHAQDLMPSSKLMGTCLEIVASIRRKIGDSEQAKLKAYLLGVEYVPDLSDLNSYLKQLDLLIVKHGFDRNPSVINGKMRTAIRENLAVFAVKAMHYVHWESENTSRISVDSYVGDCTDDVSERTRVYVKKLLIDKFRSKDFVRQFRAKGIKVTVDDLHLIGL